MSLKQHQQQQQQQQRYSSSNRPGDRISIASNASQRASQSSQRKSLKESFSFTALSDFFTDHDAIDLHLPTIERESINKKRYIGSSFSETYDLNRSWLIKVFRFLVFYSVGVLVYYHVEGWTGLDCVYFITQTISTVGYGNLSPVTTEGQIFTIFYIYCGILLVFSVINDVTSTLVDFFRTKYKKNLRKKRLEIVVRHTLNSLMWVGVLFAVICFGGIVFSSIEKGWDFQRGIYFAAVTTTTVGYGDYSLNERSAIWFNNFYILIFVAITALALQKLSNFKRHIDETEMNHLLNAIEPSPELLEVISTQDAGLLTAPAAGAAPPAAAAPAAAMKVLQDIKISKAEFVLHMLQLAGKIDRNADMLKWMDRFEEYDIDHDGYLTLHDVETYERIHRPAKELKRKRKNRKKSIWKRITDETKDVLLETLKLKELEGDEVIPNQAISPIHERKASATNLTTAALEAKRKSFCRDSNSISNSIRIRSINEGNVDEEHGVKDIDDESTAAKSLSSGMNSSIHQSSALSSIFRTVSLSFSKPFEQTIITNNDNLNDRRGTTTIELESNHPSLSRDVDEEKGDDVIYQKKGVFDVEDKENS